MSITSYVLLQSSLHSTLAFEKHIQVKVIIMLQRLIPSTRYGPVRCDCAVGHIIVQVQTTLFIPKMAIPFFNSLQTKTLYT